MGWFEQIRQCLPNYYRNDHPIEIVGYLRGSTMPAMWRQMENAPRPRNQMIILGNVEPTQREWIAAGVEGRGVSQAITLAMLSGFIVLYGGFMLRPWGRIHVLSGEALSVGLATSLQSWRRNQGRAVG